MKRSSIKLKRMIKAQAVLEGQAKAETSRIKAALVDVDQRLEKIQNARPEGQFQIAFADLYVKHAHRLMAECSDLGQELEGAAVKVRTETSRLDKLSKYRRAALANEERDREEKALLEGLDRSPFSD